MSYPWDVLGLDEAHADAESVRRAYVELVKKHRPDREPERFQEIRQAYEAAQHLLSRRDETDGEPLPGGPRPARGVVVIRVPADDAPREPTDLEADAGTEAPGEGRTPSASDVVTRTAAALDAGDEDAAARILVAARADWVRAPDTHRWFPLLASRVGERYVALVGDEAAAHDAAVAVEHDGAPFAEAVVRTWAARGVRPAVAGLAEWLLEAQEPAEGSGVSVARAQTACAGALALDKPDLARRLLDEAYRRLPPPLREPMLRDAEVMLRIARELEGLRRDERHALARVLAAAPKTLAGRDLDAVQTALSEVPRTSVTCATLLERYPELAKQVRRTRRPPGAPARRYARGTRTGGNWGVFLLMVLAVGSVRGLMRCSGSSSSTRTDPSMDRIEDLQRKLDEIRLRNPPYVRPLGSDDGADLPDVYRAHPWLQPIRRRLDMDRFLAPASVSALLEGRGEIPRDDLRYPVMLRVFSDDETLPSSFRDRCAKLLEELR